MSPMQVLQRLPFYSWECISLFTDAYVIDLVIRDQATMDKFLKLLVFHINTIDGQRDSAAKLKAQLYKEERAKFPEIINNSFEEFIWEKINHRVMCRVMIAYRLLRIRQKISFSCLLQAKTLSELLMYQIIRTYNYMYSVHK